MFQKYLTQFQKTEVFPEGTEIFVGMTLVMKDGEFKQKSMFGKVQGMGNTFAKKKKKDTTKFDEAKDIVSNLDKVAVQEMSEDEW